MSTDGFEQMIDAADEFFAELADNNSKEWFAPRKEHYATKIKKPADLFAQFLAEDFGRIAGHSYLPKQFRIYRDVRFSKDKTPLNAHLHLLWTPQGAGAFRPAFFFGSEPGRLDVGTGIMGFQGDEMDRYRAFVDRWGDALTDAIGETGMTLSDWGPPVLKRVPKPYEPEHPHAKLLKRKTLVLTRPLGQDWHGQEGGLINAVRQSFEQTLPFVRLLTKRLG
ncbi:DUF2461 domain-containing protein [Flavimaricola marinus]|uniref:TIGR02453 family protein n=1 Tax=Flavimaricola marinus TaxID=1819565 RepID=A0A238L8U3_9RHOB|nr:DUF2461 domain-containing protein [Flavimaricola marinus]SMY06088.1 hypothetical protein LOM8899_00209 [Flavimaricola marinus]